MTIRHPYTFVPFPEQLPREKWPGDGPRGHERFQAGAFSGAFDCALTTVTPLCIKKHFEEVRWKLTTPYIPGSSLKGMLRNAMQVLGFGCAGQQFQNRKAEEQEKRSMVPKIELLHMTPCTKEEACLVCRIFGYAVKKEDGRDNDSAEAFGWAAKIRIFDSEPAQDWSEDRWSRMNDTACSVDGHPAAMPQDQGPRHKVFYYPFGNGRPAGWKIYRHAKRLTKIDEGYASNDCVKPGTRFAFRLEFESLSAEEFAALEFALTLSHVCPTHSGPAVRSLVHKMGYGKGVGMGSCRIEIMRRENIAARRFFGEPAREPDPEPCGLTTLMESDILKRFCDARSASGAADLLVFPTWQEFKGNPRKSIDDFDSDLAKQQPAVRSPAPPPPAPKPAPPTPDSLPKVVRCLITSIKDNMIRGDTVEEYNGSKYRFEVRSHAGPGKPVKGSEVNITVDAKNVDHGDHRFRGSQWQP